jgi:carbon storage regulator
MLVLSRKANEEIVINGNIRVRVLSADHGRIRLGIDAPPEVPIRRSEVHAGNVQRELALPAARVKTATLAAG